MMFTAVVGNLYLSRYQRWLGEEREHLFATLRFTDKAILREVVGSSIPKIGLDVELQILEKLSRQTRLDSRWTKTTKHIVYYTRKVRYFVQFFDFIPEIRNAKGTLVQPSELKAIYLGTSTERDLVLAVLNSGLFFWFFSSYSDVRNVNRREFDAFPCSIEKISADIAEEMQRHAKDLMRDFKDNAKTLTNDYGEHGTLTIQTFQPRVSKPIIDKIDLALAKHYGLTSEELDFIINYDIKYRLGQDTVGDVDEWRGRISEHWANFGAFTPKGFYRKAQGRVLAHPGTAAISALLPRRGWIIGRGATLD